MYHLLFFKGILLGFAIAVPVGPIGVLCIRKTLQFGRFSGLCSGLGAAGADTIYATIALFGLSFISDLLLEGQFYLRLIGGAFLISLGLKTFFANDSQTAKKKISHKTLLTDFISAFFLTFTNPLTLVSFLAIFASLGWTQFEGGRGEMIHLVFGVFLGSMLWWLILSEGISLFRKRVSQRAMKWITRTAGIAIIAFGFLSWGSLFI